MKNVTVLVAFMTMCVLTFGCAGWMTRGELREEEIWYTDYGLKICVKEGDIEGVIKFLAKGGNTNNRDRDYFPDSPSTTLLLTRDIEIIKLLIEAGADDNSKNDALEVMQDAKTVKLLLDSGAKVSSWALWKAANCGAVETVRLLLPLTPDIETVNTEGVTTLATAARAYYHTTKCENKKHDYIGVVELLIEAGADVRTKDNQGRTLIYQHFVEPYAKGLDKAKMIKTLISAGTPMDYNELLRRIYSGAIAQIAAENGADVHQVDKQGRTLLMEASIDGTPKKASVLLSFGADVHAIDKNGDTALMHAINMHGISNAYYKTVRYGKTPGRNYYDERLVLSLANILVEAGVNIDAGNNKGETPLMMAARYGNQYVVEFLVEKGAKVKKKDKNGNSALMHAALNGYKETVAYLKNPTQ